MRYPVAELTGAVDAMFRAAGLEADKSRSVTASLIAADTMGHATHGLALAPWYLEAIAAGSLASHGDIEVLADRPSCVAWNGRRLPGAWLIDRALDLAFERVGAQGTVTVAIGNSHHTGALATYLPRATERGLMVVLSCTGAAIGTVAPFGGITGVFAPDPIAAGIPTEGDPVLIDVSTSITTNNSARQLLRDGGRFAGLWAIDAEGRPTDDPAAVLGGGGSILPIGGLDHGHKGYALALLAEALTQGLAGWGRADKPAGVAMGVFLQVIDPAAFGGSAAFTRQTGWLADACRASKPRPGVDRVRLPGEQALARRRAALAEGVPLSASTVQALRPHAERLGVTLPEGA